MLPAALVEKFNVSESPANVCGFMTSPPPLNGALIETKPSGLSV